MENDKSKKNQGQMSRVDSIAEKFKTLIQPAQKASQLKKRVVSSLILVPFAIYAVLFSKSLFIFFAVSMAVLMTFEWCDMTANKRGKNKWKLIGFGFTLAVLIHGIYDFFILQQYYDWLMGFGLVTIIIVSYLAWLLIKDHRANSPFKVTVETGTVAENEEEV